MQSHSTVFTKPKSEYHIKWYLRLATNANQNSKPSALNRSCFHFPMYFNFTVSSKNLVPKNCLTITHNIEQHCVKTMVRRSNFNRLKSWASRRRNHRCIVRIVHKHPVKATHKAHRVRSEFSGWRSRCIHWYCCVGNPNMLWERFCQVWRTVGFLHCLQHLCVKFYRKVYSDGNFLLSLNCQRFRHSLLHKGHLYNDYWDGKLVKFVWALYVIRGPFASI